MPTKHLENSIPGDLRAQYDLAALTGRVQGKYYARATAGKTLVLLEPDVASAFPDGSSVDNALRSYLRLERNRLTNKVLQPTSRPRRKAKPKGRSRAARG